MDDDNYEENDSDFENNNNSTSGWSISKEDQKRYKKEYKSSLKNLSYESNITIDPINESELWVDIYAPKSLNEYIDDNHNKDDEITINYCFKQRKSEI